MMSNTFNTDFQTDFQALKLPLTPSDFAHLCDFVLKPNWNHFYSQN